MTRRDQERLSDIEDAIEAIGDDVPLAICTTALSRTRVARGAMLLIVTEDNKLLLHHRDNIAGISHPGCWAGFGGAIEGDESVEQALRREMKEETGLEIQDPIFLTDEIDHEGDGSLISLFYVLGGVDPKDIDLQEGVGIGVFEVEELASLEISPFVRRAIQSHLVPEVLTRES